MGSGNLVFTNTALDKSEKLTDPRKPTKTQNAKNQNGQIRALPNRLRRFPCAKQKSEAPVRSAPFAATGSTG
jgi:hypothetical protein